MQTIRITISSEKPTNVVITERKSVSKEAKRKAALKGLDELFSPILKEQVEAGTSNIGERPCD